MVGFSNGFLLTVVAVSVFLSPAGSQGVCHVNVTEVDQDGVDLQIGQDGMGIMTCPGPDDPKNFTACCFYEHGTECCPPLDPPWFYISDRLAMIIAICVTLMCLAVTIIIIICCFCPSCPLYTACRIKYHRDDVIAYAKDEELAGLHEMPPEEKKGVTIYSPNSVKVTHKDDV